MVSQLALRNILFVDVETVPQYPTYGQMPEALRRLWDVKALRIAREGETPGDCYSRAGIYAEFGRIICISSGLMVTRQGRAHFRIKSYAGHDERALLEGFAGMLGELSTTRKPLLCAHNGKEFDFPYLARRMLIQGVRIPAPLDVSGRKPWETQLLDTMELWKFGDHKHYTSLSLLTHILNIPSPKGDLDGSQVARVYYTDNDLARIVAYCEGDVLAVAQVLLRLRGEPLIELGCVERVGCEGPGEAPPGG